jgi:hypothetical protein
MMRATNTSLLALALIWQTAVADDAPWRPLSNPSASASTSPATYCAVQLGRPVPVQVGSPQPLSTVDETVNHAVVPAADTALTSGFFTAPTMVRAQAPDSPPPPPPPPPPGAASPLPAFPGGAAGGDEAYNCGVVAKNTASGGVGGFFEKCWDNTKKFFTDVPGSVSGAFQGRNLFQSDHQFDNFISPVTNPFFFEDPRALTEIRPVFMWQQTPSQNPVFRGGDNFFFGTQARLAITPWLSFVVNRLGGTWMETSDPAIGSHAGFSELWLGPKITFIRNDRTGTLMAGGMTFEIPTGADKVFQGTGSLGLAPYVSFGQSFLRSFPYGSFNFLNTTGYSFRADSVRSEFFYTNLHVDMDVANLHRIYPLIEMNYFAYTRNGHPNHFGFEGADMFNFGSNNAGHGDLSLSFGARYKFGGKDNIQVGTAFGWGLLNQTHHLEGFRWTVDMIFRY